MRADEDEPLRTSTGLAAPAAPRRYHPLWQLIVARVKEFWRHPSAIFWVYIFPVLMAVVLGIAFENPAQVVMQVDIEQSPRAEELAKALREVAGPVGGAERTRFEVTILSAEQARQRLRSGKSALAVVAPGDPTAIEYLFDPTRPESQDARRAVDDVLQRAAGRQDALAVSEQVFAEPGGRYIDFLVPGLIGASLLSGGMWGLGFVVVDMRVRNLLKRLVTTPMRRGDFLAGLMLSRLLFIVTEVIALLFCAWLLFDVRVLGSWLALVLLVFLGAWTFAGIGLLVASRARTLETASGVINLVMLPMWMVSGIFFSSDRFPQAAQPVIRILPLTALIDALRAVMIEGAGLAGVMGEVAILVLWSAVSFVLALRWFRWY